MASALSEWPVPSSMEVICAMALATETSTKYQGHTDKVSPVFDGAHALCAPAPSETGFLCFRKGGEEIESLAAGGFL